MKYARMALALLFSSGLIGATPVASLYTEPVWMTGHWQHSNGVQWAEEHWTGMRGGMMMGSGRSGNGDTIESWESTRIERGSDGVLTYWGSPMGANPVPFRMASSTPSEIVFANPAHDYPQRIRYWRAGQTLHTEISLADGSNAIGMTYRRFRNHRP